MSSSNSGSSGAPRKRGRALAAFSAINIVFLLILWFAETFIAERHWLTTVATYVPQHPYGLPTAILLFVSLVAKNRRMAALNALAALFFMFTLMGFHLHIPIPREAHGKALRVMTYNIHGGTGGVANVVAAIERIDPDVVCLQEADHYSGPSDPTPGIARELEDYHLFRYEELAILSRYPIVGGRIHRMPEISWREFLEVTLDVDGSRLTVLNAHFITANRRSLRKMSNSRISDLGHTGPVRSAQMDMLLDIAGSAENPVVITGDFNTPPRGRLYGRIARRFRDCFASAGNGFGYTYRSDMPVLRIDFIFAGDGVGVNNCTAARASASDHRPVVADVFLKK